MKQYHGHWWEPDSDVEVPGVFTLDDDGTGKLELVGGFDLAIFEETSPGVRSYSGAQRRTPILLGRCGNESFTLVNCIPTQSVGLTELTFQRFHVDQTLTGAWVQSRSEKVLRKAYVRLENLTSWARFDAWEHTLRYPDDSDQTATLRKVAPQQVDVDGWGYTLSLARGGFYNRETRASTTLIGDVTARVEIVPPSPMSVDEVNGKVQELTDWLTLATGSACGVIALGFEHVEEQTYRDPRDPDGEPINRTIYIESRGRRIYQASPDEPAVRAHDFRFTASDMPFSEVLPKWLSLRRKSPSAGNMYFGNFYAPPTYTEIRLFTMAVTAESLHAAIFGNAGAQTTEQEVAEARKRMKDTLEHGRVRELVLQELKHRPTFQERMTHLAGVPNAGAVRLLIPDIQHWATELKKARNGVAHGATDKLTPEIFQIFVQTRDLLSLVYLQLLGFDAETQQRVANDTMQHWAVQEEGDGDA